MIDWPSGTTRNGWDLCPVLSTARPQRCSQIWQGILQPEPVTCATAAQLFTVLSTDKDRLASCTPAHAVTSAPAALPESIRAAKQTARTRKARGRYGLGSIRLPRSP